MCRYWVGIGLMLGWDLQTTKKTHTLVRWQDMLSIYDNRLIKIICQGLVIPIVTFIVGIAILRRWDFFPEIVLCPLANLQFKTDCSRLHLKFHTCLIGVMASLITGNSSVCSTAFSDCSGLHSTFHWCLIGAIASLITGNSSVCSTACPFFKLGLYKCKFIIINI